MTSDLLRRALLHRRAFLTAMAAGGGTTLLGKIARGRGPNGDPEDMACAERLFDLEFTPAERKQAARRLARQRQQLETLRREGPSLQTAPAFRFDPLPPGMTAPTGGQGATWQPASELPLIESEEDLAFCTVAQLAALLRAGRTSSVALTKLSLARLKQYDPRLHCVINLLEDQALTAAARADAEIAAGHLRGPLHGIPFGAKDLLAWPGAPTTFGAKPFEHQVLDEEATVLTKLRDAGAILVAKLSMGALAMGDVWFGGRTRNPWNPEQGSSGSSAGPASAVAAGLVAFALGTETNGSIVSPCTRCGATGLRPTFGTVSRAGAMPLSWTMDKIGPIARSAVDCALVYDVIRGADGKDADARTVPFRFRPERSLEGMRIGLVDGPDRERPRERAFRQMLERAGAKLSPFSLPRYPYRTLLAVLFIEGAAVFDELTRSGGVRELVSQHDGAWPNIFRSARFFPAVEYLQAMRIRTRLIADMNRALSKVDLYVTPPFGGPTLTCTNLTGHPCVVLPHGFRKNGTPTSITLIGKLYDEARLLSVAEHWQSTTDWHRRRPHPS